MRHSGHPIATVADDATATTTAAAVAAATATGVRTRTHNVESPLDGKGSQLYVPQGMSSQQRFPDTTRPLGFPLTPIAPWQSSSCTVTCRCPAGLTVSTHVRWRQPVQFPAPRSVAHATARSVYVVLHEHTAPHFPALCTPCDLTTSHATPASTPA